MKAKVEVTVYVLIAVIIVSAWNLFCVWLGYLVGGPYVFGVIGGVMSYIYVKFAWNHWHNMAAYDEAMTDMFNSVPKSQRFGYTEDFPQGTKWEM